MTRAIIRRLKLWWYDHRTHDRRSGGYCAQCYAYARIYFTPEIVARILGPR